MTGRRRLGLCMLGAIAMLPVTAATTKTTTVSAVAGSTRSITLAGTATYTGTPAGTDTLSNPEIAAQGGGGPNTHAATSSSSKRPAGPDRHSGTQSAANQGSAVGSQSTDASRTALVASFDGLNHVQQRLANGGNQYSLEPPDQGLCVGNGNVVETVNDVTRIYDTAGNAAKAAQDLNTFFGYPAQINRKTGAVGPFVTDPSCYFDQATQRWFMTVLTLETNPASGRFLGPNHLDIAVSKTADPKLTWNVYRLPVQDDGTAGTPDHGCSLTADANGNPKGHGPCIGDYPHLGADANGFYLTTNEYSLFGPEFRGAQIYAFSKQALARGDDSVLVTQFDTNGMDNGNSGFTVWPATSPNSGGGERGGGTEYFLSSNAADEAHGNGIAVGPRKSNQLLTWALTNTRSLNGNDPELGLSHTIVGVQQYATPPPANQKAGNVPLADCLNDPACVGNILVHPPDPFVESEGVLDSNDTRMQQVTFVNGQLWGALDTAVKVKGATKAGIEWFVVNPSIEDGGVTAALQRQGVVGLANNNLVYPAIGVTSSGRGVMGFTVAGADHFPSAGYASIDAERGVGSIHIAAEGVGPQDGFSEYKLFGPTPGIARPRWGDYGAAVPVGNTVWLGSEYIGQTCTEAQYMAAPFGGCVDANGNRTRTALANWDTRITQVRVSGGG